MGFSLDIYIDPAPRVQHHQESCYYELIVINDKSTAESRHPFLRQVNKLSWQRTARVCILVPLPDITINRCGQHGSDEIIRFKQPCSIMPNALAICHPVIENIISAEGKLRTDEVWITGTEAPDRVQVSGGCWYARSYHGSVILPSDILPTTVEPHNSKGALSTKTLG